MKSTLRLAVVDTHGDFPEPASVPKCANTTPPYQRLTKALQCDPRCGHELLVLSHQPLSFLRNCFNLFWRYGQINYPFNECLI
ncbi:hypothetical protein CVS40_4623 [Lucilia cuprina]|nr:hypothetical protein CVS40_4623 [Lucilia cuprina]